MSNFAAKRVSHPSCSLACMVSGDTCRARSEQHWHANVAGVPVVGCGDARCSAVRRPVSLADNQPLEEVDTAQAPGMAKRLPMRQTNSADGPSGHAGRADDGANGRLADRQPSALPTRCTAAAVCTTGNAASAPNHQSPLPSAARCRSWCGGHRAGAEPTDAPPVSLPVILTRFDGKKVKHQPPSAHRGCSNDAVQIPPDSGSQEPNDDDADCKSLRCRGGCRNAQRHAMQRAAPRRVRF